MTASFVVIASEAKQSRRAEHDAGIVSEIALMPTTFLMLPPQSELTREWARRLAEAAPEIDIIAPETMEGAEQAIAMADGAYGRIPPALLALTV
jgi:hypothetical protein